MIQQQQYKNQCQVFLEDAKKYLEQGNLYQASEKGWGAAAQMVKAVAEKRGWDHKHHDLIAETISNLHNETKDPELVTSYNAANSLHSNFYEGRMSQAVVALNLSQVELLVGKLGRFLR